ncbi:MAG: Na+/H+ antiporter NhaC family protein [Alphaproteobacteria bacterium]
MKPKSIVTRRPSIALTPLLLFVFCFVGTGIALSIIGYDKPFYQVSPTVLIIPAIVLALLLSPKDWEGRMGDLITGAGNPTMITMCFIYLLAGAFSQVSAAIGGIESTVNFALQFISGIWLLPGIFVSAAFISVSMGSAMGTIAAVAPIALGVAESTGISVPVAMGTLVGGAMFGDNLSMISDTTIAAAKTQQAELKDKFRFNAAIALPAVIITVIVLLLLGETGSAGDIGDYHLLKILPYVAVLGLALTGMDVLIVLLLGILLAGGIGLVMIEDFTLLFFAQKIFKGFDDMSWIFYLSMMIGGLGELVRQQGGIDYLIEVIARITRKLSGKENSARAGEFGISVLVSIADICTAINTVAILICGDAARQIAKRNNIPAWRSAGLIDIFSCVFQGILPYSAQILLAGAFSGASPIDILLNVHYCYILGIVALGAIFFQKPRCLHNR